MLVEGRIRAGGRSALAALVVGCLAVCPASSLAASAPVVDGESAFPVSEHGATLSAEVNPGGLETRYEFWLEYPACQSGGGPCDAIVVSEVASGLLPAAGGDVRASASVAGLQAGYSYTYFVVAVNALGTTKGTSEQFIAAGAGGLTEEGHTVPIPENKGTPYEPSAEPIQGAEEARAQQMTLEAQQRERERAEREWLESPQYKEEVERKEVQAKEAQALAEEAQAAKRASEAPCVVPALKGRTLAAAGSALRRAHCTLGRVSRPHGARGGLVVRSQAHRRGARLAHGAAIAVALGVGAPAR